jgi:hypothetical protein
MLKKVSTLKTNFISKKKWKILIDFTKIKKGGVDIKEVLSRI